MNRMRVLAEAYKMLLHDDPGTNVSLNALRTIVKSGNIPTVQVGRKKLLNYDELLEYLKGAKPEVKLPKLSLGDIRFLR